MLPLRFSRSARRHRVGKGSALYVIEATEPRRVHDDDHDDETLLWVGMDERGRELEIIAVIKPDCLLVIHVFPTALREGR